MIKSTGHEDECNVDINYSKDLRRRERRDEQMLMEDGKVLVVC